MRKGDALVAIWIANNDCDIRRRRGRGVWFVGYENNMY